MIFDRSDEVFLTQAVEHRAALVASWSRYRMLSFVVAMLNGILALCIELFSGGHAGSGTSAFLAVVFIASALHADAQVKALKLFGRFTSINPVQPTAARSAASGG
ncbi:MAG: hypothetical protein PCFJNLEI_04095 [Verrucomicrobiae bacterium]|nr:hypothetical protein [Verrucomicrobiae bacterium]